MKYILFIFCSLFASCLPMVEEDEVSLSEMIEADLWKDSLERSEAAEEHLEIWNSPSDFREFPMDRSLLLQPIPIIDVDTVDGCGFRQL